VARQACAQRIFSITISSRSAAYYLYPACTITLLFVIDTEELHWLGTDKAFRIEEAAIGELPGLQGSSVGGDMMELVYSEIWC
jgi:hypothetical protein